MNSPVGARIRRRPEKADWNRIACSLEFRHLLAIKKMFIVPEFFLPRPVRARLG